MATDRAGGSARGLTFDEFFQRAEEFGIAKIHLKADQSNWPEWVKDFEEQRRREAEEHQPGWAETGQFSEQEKAEILAAAAELQGLGRRPDWHLHRAAIAEKCVQARLKGDSNELDEEQLKTLIAMINEGGSEDEYFWEADVLESPTAQAALFNLRNLSWLGLGGYAHLLEPLGRAVALRLGRQKGAPRLSRYEQRKVLQDLSFYNSFVDNLRLADRWVPAGVADPQAVWDSIQKFGQPFDIPGFHLVKQIVCMRRERLTKRGGRLSISDRAALCFLEWHLGTSAVRRWVTDDDVEEARKVVDRMRKVARRVKARQSRAAPAPEG